MTAAEQADANRMYNDCINGAAGFSSTDPSYCEATVQSYYPDFDAGGSGGFGQNMSDYWGNPDNWIGFTQGLTNLAGSIIGFANGKPVYATGTQPAANTQKDHTLTWVLIGIAVLAVILLLIFLLKK